MLGRIIQTIRGHSRFLAQAAISYSFIPSSSLYMRSDPLDILSADQVPVEKRQPHCLTVADLMQHKVTNTYVYNPNGNVVSEHARRLITNLLAATANPRAKVQTDSSDDSVHENRRNHVEPAQPDKTHVKKTLGWHCSAQRQRRTSRYGQTRTSYASWTTTLGKTKLSGGTDPEHTWENITFCSIFET